MGIIGAILAALKTAFMTALGLLWWAFTLPLRPFMPQPGRSSVAPPPTAEIVQALAAAAATLPASPAPAATANAQAAKPAVQVLRWAMETVKGRHAAAEEIATTLPTPVAMWVRRLTIENAGALIEARIAGIASHLAGKTEIAGVPAAVRRPHHATKPAISASPSTAPAALSPPALRRPGQH